MKFEDAIKQLKSMEDDARSRAESCHRDGEYDTVWDKDAEALGIAIGGLIVLFAADELPKGQEHAKNAVDKLLD